MFSRIRNFVSRHKKKFIFGGVVIGGLYIASRYLSRKMTDLQAKELLKSKFFIKTEKIGRETIVSLAPTLKEGLLQMMKFEENLEEIRNASKNDKYGMWDSLKLKVFAVLVTLVYAGLMLVLIVRIQLNIIAGYRATDHLSLGSEADKAYLSLSEHFLNHGVHELYDLVYKHSQDVLKDLSLKEKLTLRDLQGIFNKITASIMADDKDPIENLPYYLFPSPEAQSMNNNVQEITYKTVNVLTDDSLKCRARSALMEGFDSTILLLSEHLPQDVPESSKGVVSGSNGVNRYTISTPVPKLIPTVYNFIKKSNPPSPDFWVQSFLNLDSLHELSLLLFEAFSSS